MKILVTYYSQTGNTVKIAKAIQEELSTSHSVAIKTIAEANTDDVAVYDLVLVGSPLHASDLTQPVKNFLTSKNWRAGQQMAGFITHFAPAYPEQEMDKFTESFQSLCQKESMEYLGAFDCQGYLENSIHGVVQEKLQCSDEQWKEIVEQMTGRPNADDVERAKVFARNLV